jgi:hypothetical protein
LAQASRTTDVQNSEILCITSHALCPSTTRLVPARGRWDAATAACHAPPVCARKVRPIGSMCCSTFCAKRSGHLWSRSISGEIFVWWCRRRWRRRRRCRPWPSAAGGSGGGENGAASAAKQGIPAKVLPVRAAIWLGRRARWSGEVCSLQEFYVKSLVSMPIFLAATSHRSHALSSSASGTFSTRSSIARPLLHKRLHSPPPPASVRCARGPPIAGGCYPRTQFGCVLSCPVLLELGCPPPLTLCCWVAHHFAVFT